MTHKEIGERVDAIRDGAGDDEEAHIMEDELYADFIQHVAQKCKSAIFRSKAKKIIATKDIYFSRWCA